MNSKERVLRALCGHKRGLGGPDRVPVQFDLCSYLLERAAAKYGVAVDVTPAWYSDVTWRISANELRIAMGSDCAIVGASVPSGHVDPIMPGEGPAAAACYVNEFGMTLRRGEFYAELVGVPASRPVTVDAVMGMRFPDPLADGRYDAAKRDIESVFELASHIVGFEGLLEDLASGCDYIPALLDRCQDFTTAIALRLCQLGVDGIWLGDDFGTQTGMLISPKMWRSVFKPRYAKIISTLREARPDVVIMFHSDGAVRPIIADLVEIGVDVMNPVQPNVPGHEPAVLKQLFGTKLAFWGAIDQQRLLPAGTASEIDSEVRNAIGALGAGGGGYMCSPAHIVQHDTSLENLEAFLLAVKKYGPCSSS
ncbi:uroporphyrinogen decarboxylase [Pelomyxa schiedti]|nr:uroporphyrinogen decarboxylase [Pelomyxa schiedti]